MATDYVARLAELKSPASVSSRVKRGRELLLQYGAWIKKYHGGMPVGVLAAIMAMESDGKMSSPGDASLGEVGLYQITASFPPKVGLPAASRYDAETNVFLGCLEYQTEAARAIKQWGVGKSSADAWKLARLAFAIGAGGTKNFVNEALAAGRPKLGQSFYGRVIEYANQTGGRPYGSQSAAKVWFRVHIVEYNFMVGQQIQWGSYGPPQVVPAPPKHPSYTFPKDLLPYTGKPGAGPLALVAGFALVGVIAARVL